MVVEHSSGGILGLWPALRGGIIVGGRSFLNGFTELSPKRASLLALFSCTAFVYLLCQKHLLPMQLSAVVSKIAFFPTFPITALSRAGNYWTEVDEVVVIGCAPFKAMGHPKKLHEMGVRGVINMCAEYGGPTDAYSDLGIRQLHLPTVDHFQSSVSQLEEAVAFIDQYRKRGERVYVHCKAGHGRAAAVVLADMIKQNPHMPPTTLNAALFGRRKVRKTLYKQRNIKAFVERLKEKDKQWSKKSS